MPLPKIDYPLVEIYVHSLGKKVKFRPFLVREEKILLIAKESKDADEVRTAVMQIINNCAVDEIDVTNLPMFDVEMIFVKLRAASLGSTVRLVFNCKNEVDGVGCNTDTDYALDLEKVKYVFPEGHEDKVMLTDTVGMKLKFTTMNAGGLGTKENEDLFEVVIGLLEDNIEYIFDEEQVYKPEDFTEKEFMTFIENLTVEKLEKIQNFFATSPKVVVEDECACSKCGFVHKIRSEDLLSFFI